MVEEKQTLIRSGSILVTASQYGRYGQRAARIGPDSICRIRLPASVSVPFFQRRQGSYCAKPTRIRSGWSGQGLAKHRIWSGSKSVCRNHQARLLAGRNRPATSFPLSDPARLFHRRSRIILCKTSPGLIQFWLIVSGLGQTDPVRKQSGVQESSGPLLASVSQPIRTGCESDPACLPGSDAGAVFTCVCTLILICPRHVSQGS